MRTYHEIATENQYLYGQLEDCTMLMGLSLIRRDNYQYDQYKEVKHDINILIDHNLELIEEIWEAPIKARAANRKTLTEAEIKQQLFEKMALDYFLKNPNTNINAIAKRNNIPKDFVESAITKYYVNKFQSKEAPA